MREPAAPEAVNESQVVVDSNILLLVAARGYGAAETIPDGQNTTTLHCPRFVFVELFKHKERIAAATELTQEDLLDCLYELLARVSWKKAALPSVRGLRRAACGGRWIRRIRRSSP